MFNECLYFQFLRPLAQCAVSLVRVLIHMNETKSGRYLELKNIGNVQLSNPKRGRGRLRERSLTIAFHYKV